MYLALRSLPMVIDWRPGPRLVTCDYGILAQVRPLVCLCATMVLLSRSRSRRTGLVWRRGRSTKLPELWDARTGTAIAAPMRHDGEVISVAFSPDGARLATASLDHTARLWNGLTGVSIGAPLPHEGSVLSATFSPDGMHLATEAHAGTTDRSEANVWDITGRAPIGVNIEQDGSVLTVAFSSDDTRLATVSTSTDYNNPIGLTQFWDVQTGAAIGSGRGITRTSLQPRFRRMGRSWRRRRTTTLPTCGTRGPASPSARRCRMMGRFCQSNSRRTGDVW